MSKRWIVRIFIVLAVVGSIAGGTGYAYHTKQVHKQQTELAVRIAQEEQDLKDYLAQRERERVENALTVENLLKFTNQRRAEAGLRPLTLNAKLNASAQAKAQDMATRNYWSHDTPTGVEPWVFITKQKYSYATAGENLACGYENASDVVTGWFNSPKHRENLLNPKFTEVGFGIVSANSYECNNLPPTTRSIIVQHFARPYGT